MKKLIKGSLVGLSFSAIGIANADETKTVQQINVNDTFNIKANQSDNIVTKRKPVDLFVVWDGSPSMGGWFMFETIRDVIKSLPDDSMVTMAVYATNEYSSYKSNSFSKTMTKDEALKVIEYYENLNKQNPYRSPEGSSIKEALKKADQLVNLPNYMEFEDYFKTKVRKDVTTSIIQVTDDWAESEQIDDTFVDWAKKNAKTFMTVLQNASTNSKSYRDMKGSGHPNIYIANEIYEWNKNSKVTSEIAKQFSDTGTETYTTHEKENVDLDITLIRPDGSILTNAKVFSPSGKEYTIGDDGRLQISNVEDGEYRIQYQVNKGQGKVKTIVNANSKTIKTIENELTLASDKVTKRIEKIPYMTKQVDDDTLEVGKTRVIQKGVEGEKEITTTTKPNVENKASNTLDFNVNAGSTTTSDVKGRSIFMPVDGSGSTAYGERDNIIEDLYAIIDSLSDKDQIQLAFYEDNNATSYRSYGNTENSAPTTVMMNKEKAVKLINRVKELIAENHNYAWKTAVNELNLRDKTAEAGKPYGDIFEASRDKNLTPVIIQLTDGWTDQEDIDHEFAKWAKKNAKTFMSVIYDTQASTANKKMIEAGHPNIFLTVPQGKTLTKEERTSGILKQIQATTVETVTKNEKPTVNVNISGDGVTVTKAKLVGPVTRDLFIVDGKVVFNDKLEDGTYKVEYVASGNGTLKAEVSVNGKVVDSKTDTLKSQEGVAKVETRIIKEPVEEVIGIGTVGYEVIKEIKQTDSDYKLDYSDAHEYGRVDGDTGYGRKKVEISKKYKTIKGVRVGEPIDVTENVIEDRQDPKKLGTHDTYVVTKIETKLREVEYIDDDTMDVGTTKIIKQGRDGLVRQTSTWNTYKGYKTGEPTITEEVIYASEKQVIRRGTKVKVDDNKKSITNLTTDTEKVSRGTNLVDDIKEYTPENTPRYEKNEFIAKFDIKKAIKELLSIFGF